MTIMAHRLNSDDFMIGRCFFNWLQVNLKIFIPNIGDALKSELYVIALTK